MSPAIQKSLEGIFHQAAVKMRPPKKIAVTYVPSETHYNRRWLDYTDEMHPKVIVRTF